MTEVVYCGLILLLGGGVMHLVKGVAVRERELNRFSDKRMKWWHVVANDIQQAIQRRAALRLTRAAERPWMIAERERLLAAGLDSNEAHERFHVACETMLLVVALLSALAVWVYPPGIALVVVSCLLFVGWYGPRLWLANRRQWRQCVAEREMPFVLALLHAGSTAGMEPVRIIDRMADIVSVETNRHPIARELGRAQWYARMGSSWDQGLKAAGVYLGEKSVARAFESISLTLAHDGPKDEILRRLCIDAQDEYCTKLDQRAALLPSRLALVLLLMVSGCTCLFGVFIAG